MSRPAFGTSPIRCARRGCDWKGKEGDRIVHPDDAGKFAQRLVCPACHHTDYTFPRRKRVVVARLEREVHQFPPDPAIDKTPGTLTDCDGEDSYE